MTPRPTTLVAGVTVELISADEIGQAWENIEADWPRGKYPELLRYIKDTIHDCQVLASHYEDAARLRADLGSRGTAVPSSVAPQSPLSVDDQKDVCPDCDGMGRTVQPLGCGCCSDWAMCETCQWTGRVANGRRQVNDDHSPTLGATRAEQKQAVDSLVNDMRSGKAFGIPVEDEPARLRAKGAL